MPPSGAIPTGRTCAPDRDSRRSPHRPTSLLMPKIDRSGIAIPDRLTLDPSQTGWTYFFGPPLLPLPPGLSLPLPLPGGVGVGVGEGVGDGEGAGEGEGEGVGFGDGEGDVPPPPLVDPVKTGSKSLTFPFIEDPTLAPSARLAAPTPTPTTQSISAYSDELAPNSFLRKLRRREMPFRTSIDCPRLHGRLCE